MQISYRLAFNKVEESTSAMPTINSTIVHTIRKYRRTYILVLQTNTNFFALTDLNTGSGLGFFYLPRSPIKPITLIRDAQIRINVVFGCAVPCRDCRKPVPRRWNLPIMLFYYVALHSRVICN